MTGGNGFLVCLAQRSLFWRQANEQSGSGSSTRTDAPLRVQLSVHRWFYWLVISMFAGLDAPTPRRNRYRYRRTTWPWGLGLWPLGVVLVFELLSGFLAIECPIDRDAISVGSPVPGTGFRPENPDLAESALP